MQKFCSMSQKLIAYAGMADLTAVKIRGKRNRKPQEKWHYGKKRKAITPSLYPSDADTTSQASVATSTRFTRKQRRRELELSRLEQLPTEILQLIFQYSANVDLALTSPRMSLQLANAHLYDEITSHVFEPFLETSVKPTPVQFDVAARLLESRFFTWEYFRTWLDRQLDSRESMRGIAKTRHRMDEATFYRRIWKRLTLGVEGNILPPLKLLRPPFTDGNAHLLKVLLLSPWRPVFQLEPSYIESVKATLRHAAASNESKIMAICIDGFETSMTFEPDLLRTHVLEGNCDVDIVQRLIAHLLFHPPGRKDMDWLDPDIWAWASRAKKVGDRRGEWLMQVLRDASALSAGAHTDYAQRQMEWERRCYQASKLLD